MSIEDKKEKKEVEFRAPSPPQGAGKPGVGQGRDGQHTLTGTFILMAVCYDSS